MSKANLIPLAILSAVIGFVLMNTFLAAIKPIQPKITVTTPKVIIQQPAPQVINKTVIIKQQIKSKEKPVQHKGFVHAIKRMFNR